MPDVIGIDHVYISVADMQTSLAFYDRLMPVLGFVKQDFVLGDAPHVQYYNRHFGFVIRPATQPGPYSPGQVGLHHFCFRVESQAEVHHLAEQLTALGIAHGGAQPFPEYAADYVAVFFRDPDGLQLEVTNYRQERRERYEHGLTSG